LLPTRQSEDVLVALELEEEESVDDNEVERPEEDEVGGAVHGTLTKPFA
jgi:hypothetical protein